MNTEENVYIGKQQALDAALESLKAAGLNPFMLFAWASAKDAIEDAKQINEDVDYNEEDGPYTVFDSVRTQLDVDRDDPDFLENMAENTCEALVAMGYKEETE